ncbi:hypothetical protein [Anaerocolumna xylanovorans]|uniref:CobQ/CobB/MinD/ParA nucleotide binding domain-containing protein n=1 Tax=Anaerocolumna xylanovorans DSM 12503 TaxID=1121345 RepID=A0A1M7Y9T5_9FIRM|nr:hypothetical protein [Anaerocolumna xylanovorans]SHO49377.1 hypothetical protein SAMN02745217_02277 [Anaerocolumna xylanovorans DSM 12503]
MRLFKESKREYKGHGRLVIGITGTHRGAGVTHLGLVLTACISEGLGLSTAFLHWADNKDICFLKSRFLAEQEDVSPGEPFTVSRASFYPWMRRERVAEVLAKGYECIIMDFGSSYKEHREEFLRCDIKVVAGSLAPWKRYLLEEFIVDSERITGSMDWIYAINHSNSKERAAARDFQRTILPVPYGPDPFFLSPDAMNFTKNLLINRCP